MFRLLLILAIISFSNGYLCQKKTPSWKIPHRHHWKHRDEDKTRNLPDNDFSQIVQKHIELEEYLQTQCKNNGNHSVTEVYGTDSYILKYYLPEYDKSNITVTINVRLLTVNAEKVDADGKKKVFKDVKLLPDIVNSQMAKWIFESKLLKIFIPYRVIFGINTVKDCGTLNRNIINVPIMAEDISSGFVFRSIDNDKANELDGDIKLPKTVY